MIHILYTLQYLHSYGYQVLPYFYVSEQELRDDLLAVLSYDNVARAVYLMADTIDSPQKQKEVFRWQF